eukprot:EG_transcript_6550
MQHRPSGPAHRPLLCGAALAGLALGWLAAGLVAAATALPVLSRDHGERLQLQRRSGFSTIQTRMRAALPQHGHHGPAGEFPAMSSPLLPPVPPIGAAALWGAPPLLAFVVLMTVSGRPAPSGADTIRRLRTGSDVRGHVAADGVASDPTAVVPQLDNDLMYFFGVGFARWLQAKSGRATVRIAVGRDPRLHGPRLLRRFAAGCAAAAGTRVTDVGLATTPAMCEACVDPLGYFSHLDGIHGNDGSVMITASHLPQQWNGLKFFTAAGGLSSADVAAVCDLAAAAQREGVAGSGDGSVAAARAYLVAGYARQLRDRVLRNADLRGLRVVVNAGHGAGGFLAAHVLAPLGANVAGSLHLEPDGTFPAHAPNPEDAEAVAATLAAVEAAGADLGLIFDTDVDRCGIVLGGTHGQPPAAVTRNRLVALAGRIVLQQYPGSAIVTDSVTSEGLTRFLATHGGVHLRAKKGYKSVIEAAQRTDADPTQPPCHLAIETSGHAAIKENRWLDDGAYLALCIVRRAAEEGGVEGLVTLLAGLPEPAESTEVRLPVKPPSTAPDLCRAAAQLMQAAATDGGAADRWVPDPVQPEGYRVQVDEGAGRFGWVMVRPSLHEPVLTVFAESERCGGVARTLRELDTLV